MSTPLTGIKIRITAVPVSVVDSDIYYLEFNVLTVDPAIYEAAFKAIRESPDWRDVFRSVIITK